VERSQYTGKEDITVSVKIENSLTGANNVKDSKSKKMPVKINQACICLPRDSLANDEFEFEADEPVTIPFKPIDPKCANSYEFDEHQVEWTCISSSCATDTSCKSYNSDLKTTDEQK
jgi:hypothetical protein